MHVTSSYMHVYPNVLAMRCLSQHAGNEMDNCPLGLGLVVEDKPTEFSCLQHECYDDV